MFWYILLGIVGLMVVAAFMPPKVQELYFEVVWWITIIVLSVLCWVMEWLIDVADRIKRGE